MGERAGSMPGRTPCAPLTHPRGHPITTPWSQRWDAGLYPQNPLWESQFFTRPVPIHLNPFNGLVVAFFSPIWPSFPQPSQHSSVGLWWMWRCLPPPAAHRAGCMRQLQGCAGAGGHPGSPQPCHGSGTLAGKRQGEESIGGAAPKGGQSLERGRSGGWGQGWGPEGWPGGGTGSGRRRLGAAIAAG